MTIQLEMFVNNRKISYSKLIRSRLLIVITDRLVD